MFKSIPRSRFHITSVKALKKVFTLLYCRTSSVKLKSQFEESFKDFFKRSYCVPVSTCRVGIYYSLKSLELERGGEVLMPAINIPDIVNSIVSAGLTPVFVDLDLNSHNVCFDSLEKSTTSKSKVLILTHLSGIMSSDINKIVNYCNEQDIIIVEDFSQYMAYNKLSKKTESIGKLSVCSLSNGKTISTMIGGAILTDDKELRNRILRYDESVEKVTSKRAIAVQLFELLLINISTSTIVFNLFTINFIKLFNRLSKNKKEIQNVILPSVLVKSELAFSNKAILRSALSEAFFFKMHDWQYELGLWCMEQVEAGNNKRRELARKLLGSLSVEAKKNLPLDLFNLELNTFYHFPIYLENTQSFKRFMAARNIDLCGYGLAVNSGEKCFEGFFKLTPNAKYIKENCLFLPLHESFNEKQIDYISSAVNHYFEADV